MISLDSRFVLLWLQSISRSLNIPKVASIVLNQVHQGKSNKSFWSNLRKQWLMRKNLHQKLLCLDPSFNNRKRGLPVILIQDRLQQISCQVLKKSPKSREHHLEYRIKLSTLSKVNSTIVRSWINLNSLSITRRLRKK